MGILNLKKYTVVILSSRDRQWFQQRYKGMHMFSFILVFILGLVHLYSGMSNIFIQTVYDSEKNSYKSFKIEFPHMDSFFFNLSFKDLVLNAIFVVLETFKVMYYQVQLRQYIWNF